jgi:hypothetical protein
MKKFILTQFSRLKCLNNWLLLSSKKQVAITALFAVVGVALSFFLIDPVSANALGDVGADLSNILIRMMAELMLWVARIFISLTVFALRFFIELAKYNGYVDAPIVLIGWTMVRDIANMFFVVILLVIAFGTILGIDQYEWKKTLVNFILAAVLVNFSKLIAGIIIDAAHVFTITFLNAIVATAGGNIINMFHLDKVMQIVGTNFDLGEDIAWEVFGGAMMSLMFAAMSMVVVAGYAVIMVFRLVQLWVLIILSPLAYILAALPQTKSYASEWWSEFAKSVMVAPIMVFFLWLAFAALGSGNFAGPDLNLALEGQKQIEGVVGIKDGPTAVSISKVSTWENMANFFISLAFLVVGLERVQKLNPRGGDLAQSATSFGKKAVLYSSGLAAARWTGKTVGSAAYGVGKNYVKDNIEIEKAALGAYALRQANKGTDAQRTGNFVKRAQDRVVGFGARRYVTRKKRLKKIERSLGDEKDVAFKRTFAESGGRLFYKGDTKDEKGNKVFLDEDGNQIKHMDRWLRGVLEAEGERSQMKTREFSGKAKSETLARNRVKDGKLTDEPSMHEMIGGHKIRAKTFEEQLLRGEEEGEAKYVASDKGAATIQQFLEAQQGKEAAASFVDNVKDQKLKIGFEAAGAKISAIMDDSSLTTAAKMEKVGELKADKGSAFVRSLLESAEADLVKQDMTVGKTEAEASAAAVYETNAIGTTTPSLAFRNAVEQFERSFNNLDEEGRGKAGAENLMHLLYKQSKGQTIGTREQQMSYALLSNVIGQANADDAIGEFAAQANRYNAMSPEEKAELNDEDIEKNEQLIKFIGEFDLAKEVDGVWQGQNDEKAMATYQDTIMFGGNLDLVRRQREIATHVETQQRTNPNYSYADALKDENFISKKDAKAYEGELKSRQTMFNDAATQFKQDALNAGHLQNGGHQRWDSDLGMYRPTTPKESLALMAGSVRKRDATKAFSVNYQSAGVLNTSTGVLERLDKDKIAMLFKNMLTQFEAGRMLSRTRDGILGLKPDTSGKITAEGAALLGGTNEIQEGETKSEIDRFHGSTQNYVVKSLAPMLAGAPVALSLQISKKYNNTNIRDAEKGKLQAAVGGTNINATSLEQLNEQVVTYMEKIEGTLDDEAKEVLKALRSPDMQNQLRELKNQRGQRKRTNTDQEGAENESVGERT